MVKPTPLFPRLLQRLHRRYARSDPFKTFRIVSYILDCSDENSFGGRKLKLICITPFLLRTDMVSRSQKGVAGSAPPVTATAVVGGGGQNKVNVVQSNVGAISSAKGLVVASSLLVSLAATLIQ